MTDWDASLQFYELLFDGQEKVYIDIPNSIRRINGVDQLEAVRAALEP